MAGKIIIFICKWLIIPVALGVIGYKFLGPQIGRAPVVSRILGTPPAEKTQPKPTTVVRDAEPEPKKYGEPEVEVTVTRGRSKTRAGTLDEPVPNGDVPESPKSKKKKKSKAHPEDAPAIDPSTPDQGDTPPDEGGSGGAATTGGEGNG